MTFGSDVGRVVDHLPGNARAMLADGRAVLPEAPWPPVRETAPEAVVQRDDRAIHAVDRRGRRR
jgi:hypothetical protein